uniref:Uncharacterized protein n=1 Tax=Arundo donax TaxID=35708 RepID=A0A0A9E870_ARUDO
MPHFHGFRTYQFLHLSQFLSHPCDKILSAAHHDLHQKKECNKSSSSPLFCLPALSNHMVQGKQIAVML